MSYPILGILEFALVFQGTMAWTASVLNPFLWSLFFSLWLFDCLHCWADHEKWQSEVIWIHSPASGDKLLWRVCLKLTAMLWRTGTPTSSFKCCFLSEFTSCKYLCKHAQHIQKERPGPHGWDLVQRSRRSEHVETTQSCVLVFPFANWGTW